MTRRRIIASFPALRDDIGDLVTRRPVPGPGTEQVDPFLFLNHHGPQTYPPGNAGLPFGPHPHRGFETVTFILAGELAHRDTGGHESIIRAGGVQWMTAGSGLVHAELSPQEFRRRGGQLEILQLWVNLPGRLKMSPPRYIGLQREAIPAIETDGATVNLIAGIWGEHVGPIETLTGVFMSTLRMARGASLGFDGLAGRSVFLYVVSGEIGIEGETASGFTLATLSPAGDELRVDCRSDCVLLLGHAAPIGEPVVSYGPFVMNSEQEIRQAIIDYRAGLLGDMAE